MKRIVQTNSLARHCGQLARKQRQGAEQWQSGTNTGTPRKRIQIAVDSNRTPRYVHDNARCAKTTRKRILLAEEWCGNRPRPGRRERLWWWPSPAPSRPPRWPPRSTSRVRCSMLVRTRLARRRCSRRSSRRKGLTNFRGLSQLSHCCSSHCQFRLPSCPHRALTTTDIAAAACTAADPVTPLPPLRPVHVLHHGRQGDHADVDRSARPVGWLRVLRRLQSHRKRREGVALLQLEGLEVWAVE